MTSEKIRRQRRIREFVKRRSITSQEELGKLLASRGHTVTQSTLSRDLRELGIVRLPTDAGYRYAFSDRDPAPPETEALQSTVARELRSVARNESAVVIRTRAGRAQGVAAQLDELDLRDVLGTIAGDDTILVIPRTTKTIEALRRELAALFDLD
jgi:transcriptional regulator of arginine metabolism